METGIERQRGRERERQRRETEKKKVISWGYCYHLFYEIENKVTTIEILWLIFIDALIADTYCYRKRQLVTIIIWARIHASMCVSVCVCLCLCECTLASCYKKQIGMAHDIAISVCAYCMPMNNRARYGFSLFFFFFCCWTDDRTQKGHALHILHTSNYFENVVSMNNIDINYLVKRQMIFSFIVVDFFSHCRSFVRSIIPFLHFWII